MMQNNEQFNQIYELQREVLGVQHKIKYYETSNVSLKRNTERCKISIKEIEGLSEGYRTFKPLGRAFILKPKDEIKTDLIKQIEQNEKDTDEQAKYKVHFEAKQKELEKQLTEMLQGLKL